jgi:hypothetical protein
MPVTPRFGVSTDDLSVHAQVSLASLRGGAQCNLQGCNFAIVQSACWLFSHLSRVCVNSLIYMVQTSGMAAGTEAAP